MIVLTSRRSSLRLGTSMTRCIYEALLPTIFNSDSRYNAVCRYVDISVTLASSIWNSGLTDRIPLYLLVKFLSLNFGKHMRYISLSSSRAGVVMYILAAKHFYVNSERSQANIAQRSRCQGKCNSKSANKQTRRSWSRETQKAGRIISHQIHSNGLRCNLLGRSRAIPRDVSSSRTIISSIRYIMCLL